MKKILLLVFGTLLCADAIWLLAQDKINLGIVLPLIIGIIFIICGCFSAPIQKLLNRYPHIKVLYRVCWNIFWLWLFSLFLFFAYLHFNSHKNNSVAQVQAILVLGSGIENGQPSPTLKARLDAAAQVAGAQPQAAVIMTGGLGFNENTTEADVMQRYMRTYHPQVSNKIYQEIHSTSTELNLINTKGILKQLDIPLNAPIAITTSDFHLPRAQAIAAHIGYSNIYPISAPTPLYIRYNARLREYFAFISGWLLNEY